MSTPEPTVKVENVVASVNLNTRIDLDAIQEKFVNVDYNPEKFPGLVFKLKKPRTATLIFSSGKMVLTGAKAEKEAYDAVNVLIKKLTKKGILRDVKPDVKIQNIVASGSLHGTVNLEDAALVLEGSMYEPEQFPGLIYRIKSPKAVILLFASGKIVCTGARRESEVHEVVKRLKEKLEEHGLIRYKPGL